ncbi:MAG: glycosyltransferase [Christensenellales bacterium]
MRVLHIANSYFFVDRLLFGKLKGLASEGVVVEAAAPVPKDAAALPFLVHHLPIPRSISPVGDAIAFFRALEIIRKGHYDIVHTHSAKAGFVGRLAAYFLDVPCVHSAHGLPFYAGQSPLCHGLFKSLERFAGRRCSLLLAQNHEDCETLRTLLPDQKVLYEGNGLNVAATAAYSCQRDAARKRLGLRESDVAVAMFARFEPVKRQDVFLDAFEQAAAQNSDLIAVFAGADMGRGGKFADAIRQRIEHSPFRSRILNLGFLKEPLSTLCGCDIVALTSEKEGIPRIVMEGMALSLPICATDAPGTRELVRHGANGLLSPVGDSAGFCANLLELARDERIRKSFGEAGNRFAQAELDESLVIKRIMVAYSWILADWS